MTSPSSTEASSAAPTEYKRCFACNEDLPEATCVWCACPRKKGNLAETQFCRSCAQTGRAICPCGHRVQLEELRTPPDHFKMHLQERNMLPLEDQCSIDTAGALLVVLESIRTCSFRYRFYATLPEAQEQLETYTGVVYKFDKDRCRLTGEIDCSLGDRFDLRVPSTWRCAWAVSMIRWNTGLLNCHFLSCHEQPLSERLMRRGIMPGDAADNALGIGCMMEAKYVLVTKEGTWYYFYGFRTEPEAVHAMLKWFFTDSIVFAVDVTKGDLVEEVRSRWFGLESIKIKTRPLMRA